MGFCPRSAQGLSLGKGSCTALQVPLLSHAYHTDDRFLLGHDAFTDHNVVIDQAQYVSD